MKYWVLVLALLSLVFFAVGHEAFGGTSPGTLIQLQASHVPDKTDFQLQLIDFLDSFKKGLEDLSKNATTSTRTQSEQTH